MLFVNGQPYRAKSAMLERTAHEANFDKTERNSGFTQNGAQPAVWRSRPPLGILNPIIENPSFQLDLDQRS